MHEHGEQASLLMCSKHNFYIEHIESNHFWSGNTEHAYWQIQITTDARRRGKDGNVKEPYSRLEVVRTWKWEKE